VTDVDTHSRLDDAIRLANAADISLAVSNPCFEIWPLLHLRNHSASCESKARTAVAGREMPVRKTAGLQS
jgi:hypothetical protein